jgi:hypothetical protein
MAWPFDEKYKIASVDDITEAKIGKLIELAIKDGY